jgi:hypothetical protein
MLRTHSLMVVSMLSIGACAAEEADSRLTIENASSYSFIEINLSPEAKSTWGADLLGADVLAPSESLIVDVSCDTYDIRVLDEDNVECVLRSVDLCFDNAVWQIDDAELISCEFQL